VSVPDALRQGDLAAFEPSSQAVEFEARTDAEFVLGSAVPLVGVRVLDHIIIGKGHFVSFVDDGYW
jgi:DNA repair protein RadC